MQFVFLSYIILQKKSLQHSFISVTWYIINYTKTHIPDLEASVLYTFLFWGRIAVFRKWILDGCTEPIQDIYNVLNRISSAGFESVYELFDH